MSKKSKKGASKQVVELTPAQKAARTRREKQRLEKAEAVRLAQIVNLHIGGWTLAEIGAATGMTEAEVDRLLAKDVARYVRSQPALRVYVRNWIGKKFTDMLAADIEAATDENHPAKLENQDRAIRILDRMAKLHGADAPVQTEIKIETAPEAVEALVRTLSAQQGQAYDDSIFDVEIVEDDDLGTEVVGESVSGNEEDGDGDE